MGDENISSSYLAAVQGFAGVGAGAGSSGGVFPLAALTQHWMSSEPGQWFAWNVPDAQPLFLRLRQVPLPTEGTVQAIVTQHLRALSAGLGGLGDGGQI